MFWTVQPQVQSTLPYLTTDVLWRPYEKNKDTELFWSTNIISKAINPQGLWMGGLKPHKSTPIFDLPISIH